ncbi:hypothetical protein LWI28_026592 [Acer negundo]|uniref:Uncharacterized protein n=1 Tax=Acer negundo TaxID=4023 RepID=A0AAD5P4W9_ACENE|nr:hypothetical protein LWI28_026592 [Acer negundo]
MIQNDNNNCDCSFGLLGGCLCLFIEEEYHTLQLWIMKEYGVKESWTKILTAKGHRYLQPLCYLNNIKTIFTNIDFEQVLFWDSKDSKFKNVEVEGIEDIDYIPCVYVESLVSPHYRNDFANADFSWSEKRLGLQTVATYSGLKSWIDFDNQEEAIQPLSVNQEEAVQSLFTKAMDRSLDKGKLVSGGEGSLLRDKRKKSEVVSNCFAKLSRKIKNNFADAVNVEGESMSNSKVLMARKRLFLNSNFLKGECVIRKIRNSKFKISWILAEEINKFIDEGTALGFDYKDKKVRMVDVFAIAISKLKGVRQKMAKISDRFLCCC